VVLNISADHLDRMKACLLMRYASRIYENAEVVVLNKDDALANQVNKPDARQLRFTLGRPDENEFGLCGDSR